MITSLTRGQGADSAIITRTYRFEEVNEGHDDLLNGKNVRDIIVHEH